MFANTSSEKVCGLMEMRVAPYSLMTASFSASVQSGRPASTVYSTMAERSKQSRTVPMSWRSCAAERLVGVPPPM